MGRQFEAAAETFGLTLDDFEKITINAMKSAFLPYRQLASLHVIKPVCEEREALQQRESVMELSGSERSSG